MKFAHLADCHLGGWRLPELQQLNIESFRKAIDTCISDNVEFILFTGDLFDSAFPPIEVLKETFAEFRKLKDAGIKAYIIAGSHDYSVSGKTFLDVLEKAGFCEIAKHETEKDIDDPENYKIVLNPLIHKSAYVYGYPGKKSGLEVNDLKRIRIKESYQDHFRILMLHTTIDEVKGDLPIESIGINDLPHSDYYALGHIHIDFEQEINGKPVIYGGPTFPNNFKELEELKCGCFYIIEVEGYTKITKKEIKLKEVEVVKIELEDALKGTEQIISELEKLDLEDKIVLLKVFGVLQQGKISDINFVEIKEFLERKGVYAFLKNTSKLTTEKQKIDIQFQSSDMERVEDLLIKKYEKNNPSQFNHLIFPLMGALSLEKQEGEKKAIFENRLLSELNKVLKLEL
ncbi:exonuclease SbcCD subunit D [Candidatus Pacearchaeota archaeon]|nr:exonuclease SbcCD subunit D [Candidatus Pacearchaeota archaeon]